MCGAAPVTAAGFVLAGGQSIRMGRDKALLLLNGRTLVEHTAANVAAAAGNVTVIADPVRYAHLGLPVIADHYSGCGPLGGVITALTVTQQPWNLIVACDMPNAGRSFLEALLTAAARQPADCECVAPWGLHGVEPLCAVYHRQALAKLQSARERNLLKMQTVTASLQTTFLRIASVHHLRNINTPEDWAAHE